MYTTMKRTIENRALKVAEASIILNLRRGGMTGDAIVKRAMAAAALSAERDEAHLRRAFGL